MRIVLCVVLAALAVAYGEPLTIRAARLVQYDRSAGSLTGGEKVPEWYGDSEPLEYEEPVETSLGSRGSSFDLTAVAVEEGHTDILSRRCAVILASKLGPEWLEAAIDEFGAEAVLVIIPTAPERGSPSAAWDGNVEVLASWSRAESLLATRRWDAPIYFARGTPRVLDMYASLSTESLQLVSTPAEGAPSGSPQSVRTIPMTNVHGWLSGSETEGPQRTVAITASYDALGAVPGFPASGVEDPVLRSTSGAVVLVEVARLLSRMYESPSSRPPTAVLFVLTAGGALNHAGTRRWLSSADARVLETVSAVICLDDLMPADAAGYAGESGDDGSSFWPQGARGLYLHVSRRPSPKHPHLQSLYDSLTSTAESLGVPLGLVHRRINVSDPTVAWAHEHLSLRRIPSVTISAWPAARTGLERSSLFDDVTAGHARSQAVRALARAARFVAEGAAAYVYGLEKQHAGTLFGEGVMSVSDAHLEAAQDVFVPGPAAGAAGRDPVSATKNGVAQRAQGLLGAHTDASIQGFVETIVTPEVSAEDDPAPQHHTLLLYDSPVADIGAHSVKSALYDGGVLLLVVGWLFLVHTASGHVFAGKL